MLLLGAGGVPGLVRRWLLVLRSHGSHGNADPKDECADRYSDRARCSVEPEGRDRRQPTGQHCQQEDDRQYMEGVPNPRPERHSVATVLRECSTHYRILVENDRGDHEGNDRSDEEQREDRQGELEHADPDRLVDVFERVHETFHSEVHHLHLDRFGKSFTERFAKDNYYYTTATIKCQYTRVFPIC